jgi:hypothetical protein
LNQAAKLSVGAAFSTLGGLRGVLQTHSSRGLAFLGKSAAKRTLGLLLDPVQGIDGVPLASGKPTYLTGKRAASNRAGCQ